MLQADILDWKKQKQGQLTLLDEVFGLPERKDLWHSVVRWQLASRRQGSHQAKTKGEVSGGGKKPFRQKGTGNARQGSSRSPLNEGGGVIFAPRPRDYSYQLPKKMRRLALCSALSSVYGKGRLFVLDKVQSKEGKTAELSAQLTQFFAPTTTTDPKTKASKSPDTSVAATSVAAPSGAATSVATPSGGAFKKRVKVLMIDTIDQDEEQRDVQNKVQRASSNLQGVCYYGVEALNVYDLLRHDNVIVTRAAVDKIHQRFVGPAAAGLTSTTIKASTTAKAATNKASTGQAATGQAATAKAVAASTGGA